MKPDRSILSRPTGAGSADDPGAALLSWCARRFVAGDGRAADATAAAPIDALDDRSWSQFLREAQRHSMLPLAWRALESAVADLPELIARDLRTAFEQNTRRNLWLAAELLKVLDTFRRAGIAAAPWKGPLLAERAYGDIRLRQFFDLDVLVRRADLSAARDLLLTAGFSPEKAMTEAQQDIYVKHQGELEMVRESDGLWLELHTAIVPTYYGHGRTSDELWDRLLPATLARVVLSALDPVDELEALCVHGSKHRWDRLAWIVDVALMSHLIDDRGWRRLLAGSSSHGTRRMVHIGLLLAVDLVGAVVPGPVESGARRDGSACALAAQARSRLFDPRPTRFDALLFHARMRERQRDRARYLLNVLFAPSGADWEALALPRPLFPLYALTRPVRLAIKYGRRVLVGEAGMPDR